MNLGESIRKNTSWILGSNIISQVIKFGVGIALARLLTPEIFGLLITVQVFTGAAGFIAGGGMGQALIQAKNVTTKHFRVVFTLQFAICSLIYCFFYNIAPYFSVWFNNPIYTDLLRISALTFLIRPFASVAKSKLHREMNFKIISLVSFVGLIIGSGTSIILAINNYGVWSLVLGGIIGPIFTSLLYITYSKCYPGFEFDSVIAKKLGSYGFQASVNNIVGYLKTQIPNFLIGKFLGPSTVGLFNKGSSLSEIPVITISGSAYQTVFRALSSSQDNLDQSKYIYLRTITLVSIYTFPFYIGLFWLSESFILTVYGEQWLMAAIPLQILSISGLFRCITNTSGAVMAAQNLLGTEIKIQLIALVLTALGCWYGVVQGDIVLIAFGLLPSTIFLSTALSYNALQQLNATYSELFQAIRPAIRLNLILASILAITDIEIRIYLPDLHISEYLIILSSIGCISYSGLFLFYPIQALEKESLRWKKLFRLTTPTISIKTSNN